MGQKHRKIEDLEVSLGVARGDLKQMTTWHDNCMKQRDVAKEELRDALAQINSFRDARDYWRGRWNELSDNAETAREHTATDSPEQLHEKYMKLWATSVGQAKSHARAWAIIRRERESIKALSEQLQHAEARITEQDQFLTAAEGTSEVLRDDLRSTQGALESTHAAYHELKAELKTVHAYYSELERKHTALQEDSDGMMERLKAQGGSDLARRFDNLKNNFEQVIEERNRLEENGALLRAKLAAEEVWKPRFLKKQEAHNASQKLASENVEAYLKMRDEFTAASDRLKMADAKAKELTKRISGLYDRINKDDDTINKMRAQLHSAAQFIGVLEEL